MPVMPEQILAVIKRTKPRLRLWSSEVKIEKDVLYVATQSNGSLKVGLINKKNIAINNIIISVDELTRIGMTNLSYPLMRSTECGPKLNGLLDLLSSKGHLHEDGLINHINPRVNWLIDQDNWESELAAIVGKIDPTIPLHLLISGGHGTAGQDGAPLTLNGIHESEVKEQVTALQNYGLCFSTIVLNSCYSASFIPYFQNLLMPTGVIFANIISASYNVTKLLNAANLGHRYGFTNRDIFSAYFTSIDYWRVNAADNGLPSPVLSDVVYIHRNKRLERYRLTNLNDALNRNNDLIVGQIEALDTVEHLNAIQQNLKNKGITIRDNFIHTDQMEINVRVMRKSPIFEPLAEADIETIIPLDKQIFPDEPAFTLQEWHDSYHEDYSFLARDPDHLIEIAGYIFATVKSDGSLWINNVGIQKHYQAAGIGAQLLEHVVKKADVENRAIKLQVRNNNINAISLYTKFGFTLLSSNSVWQQMTRSKKILERPSAPVVVKLKPAIQQEAVVNNALHTSQSSASTRSNEQRLNCTLTPVDAIITNQPMNYYFILQSIAVMSLGAALLALGCLLLPQAGLIAVSLTAGYALSSVSFASGVSAIGFWGHQMASQAKTESATLPCSSIK